VEHLPDLARRPLGERVRAGDPVLGTFVKSSDPSVAEILAGAGFDFLVVDLEHSTLGMGDLESIVRAAALHSVAVLARVPADGLHQAGRALDAGAVGIQVSGVVDGATAAHALSVCSYPPAGNRSMSLSHRGAEFGQVGAAEHLASAERELVVVGQVESVVGTEALPLLLAQDLKVDVWFLGSLDLSVSLGHAGSLTHPDVVESLCNAADAILRAGARLGVFAQDPAEAEMWLERGATMVTLSSDYALLAGRARTLVEAWRDGHRTVVPAASRASTATG
jgi:4-hydroxy-2-oxoheptanedioate aldolase